MEMMGLTCKTVSGIKRCAKASEKTQINIPQSKEFTMILGWESVFNVRLAKWGAMIPTNAIGPAKAVESADRIAVKSIRIRLVFFVFTPADSAYKSPNK